MDKEARKKMGPVSLHVKCVLDKMEEIEAQYPSIIGKYMIEFTNFQITQKQGFALPYRVKREIEKAINECNLKFL
jgi:hypothetical protein